MRVLWLSSTSGLYGRGNHSYNGGGWVASLQRLLEDAPINLGLAFITHTSKEQKEEGHTKYYPIYVPDLSGLRKLRYYYGNYRKENNEELLTSIGRIIEDFRPDAIHVFGLENPLAAILGKTSIPVVVHLQGLMGPCDNAFWPSGINASSFTWPFTMREWVLRNGYKFAKKSTHVREQREDFLFQCMSNAMGRTEWDRLCTSLMAPQARYFHVDEVLRPVFYTYQGQWQRPSQIRFQIISVISNTVYKGLDLILKAAMILKRHTSLSFTWKVAGIKASAPLVGFFEKVLGIESENVGIAYLGVLSAEDLCRRELQSHCYVHPSYIDNSPNSLCEAQLLGVPCISTNVGGTSSLVKHGETGILVPANAPYELAYYIQQLACSAELSSRLSTAGSNAAAQRHNQETIVQQLLGTYQSILHHERS